MSSFHFGKHFSGSNRKLGSELIPLGQQWYNYNLLTLTKCLINLLPHLILTEAFLRGRNYD